MAAAVDPSVYTDFQALVRLRSQAREQSPEALRAVAKQFESLFVQMMLKSMRDASLGEGIFDSDRSNFYRDMYDQQLAVTLSEKQGLGLADLMVRQLGGDTVAQPDDTAAADVELDQTRPVFNGAPFPLTAAPAAPTWMRTMPAMRLSDEVALIPDDVATHYAPGMPVDIGNPTAFVQTLWPQAQQAAQELGVNPKVLLAQAALETGWGRAVIRHSDGNSSHNLFGIKADRGWDGRHVTVSTLEYQDGIAVRSRAAFRSYGSFAESFQDYVDFLRSNPRYASALRQTASPEAFAAALQRAGYATDPNYARKINNIVNGEVLRDALSQLKIDGPAPLS